MLAGSELPFFEVLGGDMVHPSSKILAFFPALENLFVNFTSLKDSVLPSSRLIWGRYLEWRCCQVLRMWVTPLLVVSGELSVLEAPRKSLLLQPMPWKVT